MNALSTHLDDLLAVLRASADLSPTVNTAAQLRSQLTNELDAARPDLAARLRALDDWHTEILADFITDAHVVADALEHPSALTRSGRPARRPESAGGPGADDTRVG